MVFNGNYNGGRFGQAVSVGDVNGDGFKDAIVAGYSESNLGNVYIYFGGLSMNNTPNIILNGSGGHFGYSTNVGDFNNDGYDDIIVGARRYNNDHGRIYIYLGSENMDNLADVVIDGQQTGENFGTYVSSAGDVNNDGYQDVLIGAQQYTSNGTGKAYIYFGGSSIDNVADVIFHGENAGDLFGHRVSQLGDVNGDGFDDIIVGALYAEPNKTGKAYIYFGSSSMDNIADIVLKGEYPNDNFGLELTTGSDLNNDGYMDIMVGAQGNDDNGDNAGKVYVYFGGQLMDNNADITILGQSEYHSFGRAISYGDINADGLTDVFISAPGYDNSTGSVYIYYGLADTDNLPDVIIRGDGQEDLFGVDLIFTGDISFNGYSNLLIGARSADGSASNSGRAYLYHINIPALQNPSNLIITAANNYSLDLSWDDNSNNEDGFKIERKIGNALFSVLATIGSNSNTYTDGGLTENTEYCYRVRAFKGNTYSNYSNKYCATAKPYIPEAPTNLAAMADDPRYINLTWEDNSNVETNYKVERKTTDGSFTELALLESNTISYNDNSIEGETEYTYRVRAYNADGETHSEYSNEATITSLSQELVAIITTDSVWIDTRYDGVELGIVDASESYATVGNITSYIWTLDEDTLGQGVAPTIELPSGTNKLKLTIKSDQGNEAQTTKIITLYAAKLATEGQILSSVSELDNKTLFISSMDDKIYKFDSTGVADWTILTGGSIQSTICISDQNNIFVGSTDARLYSFNHIGVPQWDKAMGGVMVSSPSAGPFRSIFLGLTTGRIFSVKENGDINWTAQVDGSILSSPAISNHIVYFGSTDFNVYGANILTGELVYTYPTEDSVLSSPAIDKSGNIIIGANDGYLYKLNKQLNLIWKYYSQGPIKSSPVIDEEGNIYFGSSNGFVYALSKDKELLWKYNAGSPVNGNPSLSGDGSIFIGCEDGRLLILSKEGSLMWHLQTENKIVSSPLITKTNLIYIGSTDGNVYILKDPYLVNQTSSYVFEWPTFKGNNQRDGYVWEGVTNIENLATAVPTEYKLSQNYPNPFNPTSEINYAIVKPNRVSLKVYDVLGKEIMELVNENQEAGNYKVTLNAANLTSGIYLYRIQAGDYVETKKMILLK